MVRKYRYSLGWRRNLPGIRDYQAEENNQKILGKTEALKATPKELPASENLRSWCSPIEAQKDLGSCTANVGVGWIEYFEHRAFCKGDTGAQLRDTMKALVLFGVPPKQYHPYDVTQFDREPSEFCHAFAQRYKAAQYYRLDTPSTPLSTRLNIIKINLPEKLMSTFGVSIYRPIYDNSNKNGKTKSALLVCLPGDKLGVKQVRAGCLINISRMGRQMNFSRWFRQSMWIQSCLHIVQFKIY